MNLSLSPHPIASSLADARIAAVMEDPEVASEQELVRRFRDAGDNSAFELLYRRTRRPIYALCLHFLREPGTAEDLCHDVFVIAYEQFHTLTGEQFLPWVRRIAKNQCLNRLRNDRLRERLDPKAAAPEPEAAADDAAMARQELEIAAQVIDSLPDEQRTVFLLFHTRDLSYQQIAERLGLSREQVRSHLQNSRRNFHLRFKRQKQQGTSHG